MQPSSLDQQPVAKNQRLTTLGEAALPRARARAGGDNVGAILDNVTLTDVTSNDVVIPEPGTLVLLSTGIAGASVIIVRTRSRTK